MAFDGLGFVGELLLRAVDVMVSRGAPYNSDEFMHAHASAMADAINLMPHIGSLSPYELTQGAIGVLRLQAAVVQAYHRKKKVTINANYMVPKPPTEALLTAARFCTKDRRADSFSCFLVLQGWATVTEGLPRELVLPVERLDGSTSSDQLLFGAPKAYVERAPQLICKTEDIALTDAQDHEKAAVREEIIKYFKEQRHRIRSFVSLPIEAPAMGPDGRPAAGATRVVGVVNLQSSGTYITGFFTGNRNKILIALQPLVVVLAHFVTRLHAADSN